MVAGSGKGKWDRHALAAGLFVPVFLVFVLIMVGTGVTSRPSLPAISHELRVDERSIEMRFFEPMRMHNDSSSIATRTILDEPLNATKAWVDEYTIRISLSRPLVAGEEIEWRFSGFYTDTVERVVGEMANVYGP